MHLSHSYAIQYAGACIEGTFHTWDGEIESFELPDGTYVNPPRGGSFLGRDVSEGDLLRQLIWHHLTRSDEAQARINADIADAWFDDDYRGRATRADFERDVAVAGY